MSSKASEVLSLLKRDVLLGNLKRGERLDGRGPEDYREIKIETGIIGKAEGSALVHIGDTKVIAGVKAEIGTPFPDTPNQGVQIVNAELIPLASPIFEPGPPGEDDIELARVIDRGLRSAETIRLDELVLIPGKKVWTIFIDIYSLDYNGNLFDASGLAALSALLTTNLKKTEITGENIILKEEEQPLPVGRKPVYVTLVKIEDILLVDPSYEEELLADARITFIVDESDNICGIQKGGKKGFKPSEILKAADIAIETATKLRKILPST